MNISAIVMASGLSKRMNKNKLFLTFKSKKIYEHIFDLVGEIDFYEVIVVSSYEEILKEASRRNYKIIKNEKNAVGKSESIKLATLASYEKASIMFFVADQPLLKKDTVEILIKEHKKNKNITFPISCGEKRNPVIFPSYFKQELLKLEGDKGGISLIKNEKVNQVEIGSLEEFMDIDTEEDYINLRREYEG
ncbi:MAG: NTP transferase domain-containing protein [Peptoniphilaceae bacterium]